MEQFQDYGAEILAKVTHHIVFSFLEGVVEQHTLLLVQLLSWDKSMVSGWAGPGAWQGRSLR